MKYQVIINQVVCEKFDLIPTQAALFDFLSGIDNWADKRIIDGDEFFFISRFKIVQELPVFFKTPDSAYRQLKYLEKVGLIKYRKLKSADYVRLTINGSRASQLGNNSEKLGKISENGPNSEKFPKNSEKFPKNDISKNTENQNVKMVNSEIFPTYNKINNTKTTTAVEDWFLKVKEDYPILFEHLYQSELFHERLVQSMAWKKIKVDKSDILPIIERWFQTNYVAGNLNAPTNILRMKCTSFVQSVLMNGGLKSTEPKKQRQEFTVPTTYGHLYNQI